MSYDLLSKYYDELVRFNYANYLEFVLPRVKKGRGLDIACGSGRLTAMLSAKGFSMTGLDSSEEMLNLAAVRARKARANILLLSGDINRLKLAKKYDSVFSTCDGLNYVTSEENLFKLFEEVYNALTEGGTFVFDMSTLSKAKNVLDGNTFYEDTDEYTLLWTNSLDENDVVTTELTVFTPNGSGLYAREDEGFDQYFYKNESIISYISKAGFSVEAFDGTSFTALTAESERILIVATK